MALVREKKMYKLYRWNKGNSKPKCAEQGNLTLVQISSRHRFWQNCKEGLIIRSFVGSIFEGLTHPHRHDGHGLPFQTQK